MDSAQVRSRDPLVRRPWDTVHVEYPVRMRPATGVSSTTVGLQARRAPQVLQQTRRDTAVKGVSDSVVQRHGNSAATRGLTKSQTSLDHVYQTPTVNQAFLQATPTAENDYLHGGNRRLEVYPFKMDSHGASEASSSYRPPATRNPLPADQPFTHPYIDLQRPEYPPERWSAPLIDISADTHLKYLDPYVSSSHLEHRPFTSEHLARRSNTRDVVTYYTFADVPWVRGPRPRAGDWWQPRSAQPRRPVSDREQFRHPFREVRVPRQLVWTPTSFKTETAKSFISPSSRPETAVTFEDHHIEEYFHCTATSLGPDNLEREALHKSYRTESRDMNSRRPISAVLDQLVKKSVVCGKT